MTDKKSTEELEEKGMVDINGQPEPKPDSPELMVEEEMFADEQSGEKLDSTDELTQELAESRGKAQEYLDGWQRSRAEFANYKKRKEKEQADSYQHLKGEIIKQYLEVVDDLERALSNRTEETAFLEWANGIELIYRKLLKILESEGIAVMDTENAFFDPNLHEAISSEENDQFESGEIIEVVKKGYMSNDRVLRPAQVRVAR